jgi:hypothetical protein
MVIGLDVNGEDRGHCAIKRADIKKPFMAALP